MQGTKSVHGSTVLLSIVASSLQPVLRQGTSVLYFSHTFILPTTSRHYLFIIINSYPVVCYLQLECAQISLMFSVQQYFPMRTGKNRFVMEILKALPLQQYNDQLHHN